MSPQIVSFSRASILGSTLLIGLAACSPDIEDNSTLEPLPVAIDILQQNDTYRSDHRIGGLVYARQQSSIGFEESGKIAVIEVNAGERIEAGQLLARLDTQLLEQNRQQLKAQRRDIDARIELNMNSLRRQRDLKSRGFAADQRLDELSSEEKSLAASLQQNTSALASNQLRLDKAVLYAPYAATIDRRLTDQGAVVAAGAAVFDLLESGSLEARIGVPVRLLGTVEMGQRLPITIRGQRLEATIIAIGGNIEPTTLTVQVRLDLPDDAQAVPGEQVFVQIQEIIEESGFWVSLEAIRDGPRGLWQVFVVSDDGQLSRVQSRDIHILYTSESQAYVNGALASGDRLIATGLQRITPGQRVSPQPISADPSAPVN